MKKDKLVVEEIVKYMQQQIKDGAWAVNTKIPSENELCSRLGVGRGSVRAAIQRFNVLGILESQHGRGTFVRSIDISLFGKGHYLDTALLTDMVTIRQARSLIEPELAYEAAANATPELIADLNLLNQQLKAAVGNQELFARLDAQFHMTLAEFIDNPIISNVMGQLLDQTVCLNINRVFGYYGGIYYHPKIAEAFAQRSCEQARNIMKTHMVSELFDPKEHRKNAISL